MAYDPSENVIKGRILSNINLLSAGATLLFNVPPGFFFVPVVNGRLVITQSTGTGLGTFTVSAGTNSPGYNNIYSAISPALINVSNKKVIDLSPTLVALEQIDGSIYFNVGGIATGFTLLRAAFYMPYILVKKP